MSNVKCQTANVKRSSGFTLIELVLVIALMVFVYAVAIPQFSLQTGSEVATKLGQLTVDIRSAYDTAVLSGRPHRMVFELVSGDYWLESTDRNEFYLGEEKLDRDLTEEEEADEREAFESEFAELEDLAGSIVVDPESEDEIRPTSPVINAKDRLALPTWTKITSMEWRDRTVGPYLIIQDVQAEHHGRKQDFLEMGEATRVFIYFFPHGYAEKAVIHIAYRLDDMTIDEEKSPYTVIIDPFTGVAFVKEGYEEVDVHSDDKA